MIFSALLIAVIVRCCDDATSDLLMLMTEPTERIPKMLVLACRVCGDDVTAGRIGYDSYVR